MKRNATNGVEKRKIKSSVGWGPPPCARARWRRGSSLWWGAERPRGTSSASGAASRPCSSGGSWRRPGESWTAKGARTGRWHHHHHHHRHHDDHDRITREGSNTNGPSCCTRGVWLFCNNGKVGNLSSLNFVLLYRSVGAGWILKNRVPFAGWCVRGNGRGGLFGKNVCSSVHSLSRSQKYVLGHLISLTVSCQRCSTGLSGLFFFQLGAVWVGATRGKITSFFFSRCW